MKSTPAEIQKTLEILAATPIRLKAACSGKTEDQLNFAKDRNSWSAAEILAHLRSCADLWTQSMYAMLAENSPILPDINERKYAKAARFMDTSFALSLEVLRVQREELLNVLRDLESKAWEKSAVILGRKHTVFTQSRRMAKHELEHCQQVEMLFP